MLSIAVGDESFSHATIFNQGELESVSVRKAVVSIHDQTIFVSSIKHSVLLQICEEFQESLRVLMRVNLLYEFPIQVKSESLDLDLLFLLLINFLDLVHAIVLFEMQFIVCGIVFCTFIRLLSI